MTFSEESVSVRCGRLISTFMPGIKIALHVISGSRFKRSRLALNISGAKSPIVFARAGDASYSGRAATLWTSHVSFLSLYGAELGR